MTTTSGQTQVSINQSPREFFSSSYPSMTQRLGNILGTSVSGMPFIPTFSGTFKSDNTQGTTFFNDFQTKHGKITDQIRQFGINNSIPYMSAYTTMSSGGLNFTRLAGIDLSKDISNPTYAGLKPGFNLSNTQKIYAINLQVKKKDQGLLNRYNHDILNLDNDKFLLGYIFTKDQIGLKIDKVSDKYRLTINDTFNILNLNENINSNPQRDLQNSVLKFRYNNILFNFNKNDEFFWRNVLNLNIFRLNELGYSFVYYNDVINELMDSCDITDCRLEELTGDSLNDLKNFNQEYQYAKTPWIVSQGFYSTNEMKSREDLAGRVQKLFRIHAISPGRFANNLGIKIMPISLGNDTEYARFNLHIIDIRNEDVIYQFDNLNFNQDSEDFIGRVIGTQKTYFDIITKKVVTQGVYPQQNPWIRVEISDSVMNQNFNINTIPAGFLAYPKLKTFTQNSVTTGKEILSYAQKPQLFFDTTRYQYNKLLTKHAWGKNFKRIELQKTRLASERINAIFQQKKSNNMFDTFSTGANFVRINLYKYFNNYNEDPAKNMSSDYLYDYLNNSFFIEPNDKVITDFAYTNMFHLEKIYLFNQLKSDTTIFQRWDLAKYQHSGEKIDSFIADANNINIKDLFDDSYIDEIPKILYYFTINSRSINKSFNENFNVKYPVTDSVEEAVEFNKETNVLSFTMNLYGGFDGLNMLNENQYAINDIGLNESMYLRELYKLGLDIITDDSTCLNSFTYLPEIYNSDVVNHAIKLASQYTNITFLFDKPLLNVNGGIIYCKDLLTYDIGDHRKFDNWYYQKFKYRFNNSTSIPMTLKVDTTMTLDNLKYLSQMSNIAYFVNYVLFKTGTEPNQNPFDDGSIIRQMMLPSGLIAFCIIANNITTPLTAYDVLSLSNLTLQNVYYNLIDDDSTNELVNKSLINVLSCNFFHYAGNVSSGNKYSFYSNKTSAFSTGSVSVLSRLHIRLILSEIKRQIKLVSEILLFKTQGSDVSTVTKSISITYSTVLVEFVNRGMIADFKIELDETTTSEEDLLNNLVRGSIFLKFVGSANVEVVQFSV